MTEVSEFILGLRHVGIVTEDIDGMVARLQELFGVADGEIDRIDSEETRFAFFTIGGTPYEVIQPVSEHFQDILLATNTGTNHVCYNVSDLEGAVAAMADKGVRLGHVTPTGIVTMPSFRMAYFDPADTAGILLEFVEPR
jgi:catechol 2,3-dioxygenase-like lactoylglutathione lyase family enzyme